MRTLTVPAAAVFIALSTASCSRAERGDAASRHAPSQAGDTAAVASAGSPAVAASTSAADTGADSLATSRIPFVVGLTTVSSVTDPQGDYESFAVIDALTPERYRMVVSAEVSNEDGESKEVSVRRSVRAEDQRDARKTRQYFHTGDAEQFTGTTPGVSAAVLNDLRRTGSSALTFLDVGEAFGMSVVERELSGTITRVEPGAVPVPVIVNGAPVRLPAIHAKGRLSDVNSSDEFDLYVLDDPDNPIVLIKRGPGFSVTIVKIDFPQPPGRHETIADNLAANKPVDVYGIYFSFNRANIRPESDSVLAEIAGVMKQNPTWHLRIDGHTDGIGGTSANLDLSQRRAAAVKDALVTRYGIDASRLTTGGHGAADPKDRNDTPEGRARNRRVELRRE